METQGYNAAKLIRYTWAAIFLLSIVDIFWACLAGIHTRVLPFLDPMLALGGMAGVTIYRHFSPSLTRKGTFTLIYTRHPRALDGAWFTAVLISQFAIGTLAIVIFSYLGAWLNYTLMNAQLSAVDHSMGFDWLTYVIWVNAHPLVARILTCGYRTMDKEVILILVTLPVLRQYAHLHRFILEFMSSAFITIALGTIWPAVPAYTYYKVAAAAYPNLQVLQAQIFVNELLSMRDHTMSVLPSYL